MKWWIKAIENKKPELYSFEKESQVKVYLDSFITKHGSLDTDDNYIDEAFYGDKYHIKLDTIVSLQKDET